MILYRVMSLKEFEAYKAGKTIRARNGDTVSKSRNSWRRPMICFFTSSNNCAHWRPICAGNVIVALDVRNKKALERPGWGVYPDFTAAEQPGLCDVLESLMTGKELKQKVVKVTEYALLYYNKRNAYLRDWAFVWGENYICFEKSGLVPRLPGYNDLLEEDR